MTQTNLLKKINTPVFKEVMKSYKSADNNTLKDLIIQTKASMMKNTFEDNKPANRNLKKLIAVIKTEINKRKLSN